MIEVVVIEVEVEEEVVMEEEEAVTVGGEEEVVMEEVVEEEEGEVVIVDVGVEVGVVIALPHLHHLLPLILVDDLNKSSKEEIMSLDIQIDRMTLRV